MYIRMFHCTAHFLFNTAHLSRNTAPLMTSANNNGALLTQSGPQAFSLFAVQYKKEFNAVHKIQQKYRPCISIHLAENL